MEEELKLFVFGRCIGGESVKMLSILERVLASPGASGLINLIWDKFKLDSREEILNIVSTIRLKPLHNVFNA